MVKLTKRLARCVWLLDGALSTRAVEYEVSLHYDVVDIGVYRLTYSDTERTRMTRGLNWLLEFVDSGPMDDMTQPEKQTYRDGWRGVYYTYCDTWDTYRQDELDAWNRQPEQVARNGLSEFAETLGRQDDGPKETQFDKLRAWAGSPAILWHTVGLGYLECTPRGYFAAMQGRPIHGSHGTTFQANPIATTLPAHPACLGAGFSLLPIMHIDEADE